MFSADTLIDTIQTGKKEFVKTFVKHEEIAKAMNSFVDAQTEYTKKAAKAGTDVATKLASEAVKATQEAAKYDYSKHITDAYESFTKAFQTKTK